MTERERQILEWIRQNPMISQNELAELAGITRSGVAAHISNLVKKGYLRGKGYIVAPPRYVTVIGGLNMDILGVSDKPIMFRGSNTGHVYNQLGGEGRSVAVGLSRLGVQTCFITLYGDDANGEVFKTDAVAQGIDITYARQIPHTSTSTYIYVNQPDGDIVVGLDDMGIYDLLTPDFLEERRHIINNSTDVVIDTNISQEAIEWVYEHCERPIYAKAISVYKAGRLGSHWDRIDTLAIDAVESEVVSGVDVHDRDSAERCADVMQQRGVHNVFVCVGEKGMLYRCEQGSRFFPPQGAERRNSNGSGAVALAALVWAHEQRCSWEDAGALAVAAAVMNSEAIETVSPQIAPEAVESRANNLIR